MEKTGLTWRVAIAALILITAGFWAIQGQLYASMPDYVIRMAGETYKPEWYANVNPLVVVSCVIWVTQMVRTWSPAVSITVAMTLIPLSSLATGVPKAAPLAWHRPGSALIVTSPGQARAGGVAAVESGDATVSSTATSLFGARSSERNVRQSLM